MSGENKGIKKKNQKNQALSRKYGPGTVGGYEFLSRYLAPFDINLLLIYESILVIFLVIDSFF